MGKKLTAQTNASQAIKPARQQRADDEPVKPGLPTSNPAATRPPVPLVPTRPADQPANQAMVSWDSRGLEIEASNSSLNQILQQVAALTGSKVEGLTQDQRVFGGYGPGPASDVLWKLLDGSGYNVLMTGGRDAHTPLDIVLSSRSSPNRQTAANNQSRGRSDVDEVRERLKPETHPDNTSEPPQPQPNQNPFANGEPARDPVQFMQEILQRQQRIDQQQQQDQQNNPHQ